MRYGWLILIAFVLIGFSLIWGVITYLPIVFIEARYQTQQTLQAAFGTTNLGSIFLPSFEFLNTQGNSRYRDYGINVPALGIDEPVVFNVDPNDRAAYTAALQQGIAHASGTAFPDTPGLGYYFAHSSNPDFRTQYNAIFYLLGKLKIGDEVYIWHDGKKYEYQVTNQRITDPRDVSFLNQDYPLETIVLQTCWPPGTTRERLLVFAERKNE